MAFVYIPYKHSVHTDDVPVSYTHLYGEVGHEYQFNIGDGASGSFCYEQTVSFLSRVTQT